LGFTGIAILTHLAVFGVMNVLAEDWLSRRIVAFTTMLAMMHAPFDARFLYWEMLYGGVFLVGTLRRNWGSLALLEADTNEEQIERTSTSMAAILRLALVAKARGLGR
jgi:hypothetical protein